MLQKPTPSVHTRTQPWKTMTLHFRDAEIRNHSLNHRLQTNDFKLKLKIK